MRRVALTLAVLGIITLAGGDLAVAEAPSHASAAQLSAVLVGHHGHRGHSRGHGSHFHRSHGSHYHRSPHRRHSYRHGMAPVIIHPMVPGHPAVIYGLPGYAPRIHHGYRYYHAPSAGLHYRGHGFGFSIHF